MDLVLYISALTDLSCGDDDEHHQAEEACPICLDMMEQSTCTATLPCGHRLCVACLTTLRKRCHRACPLCRAPLPPPAKELFEKASRLYFPLKARIGSWDNLSLEDQIVMDEVLKLWKLSAQQGLAAAQCNMGFAIRKGRGATKNFSAAVGWYRKAAQSNNANAECNLGLAYYLGRGAPQNHAIAAAWYRKSADQGYATAQFNLGLMYAQGSGLPKSDDDAVRWYRMAAYQGHADAQVNLGNAHYSGIGVERSATLAARWYHKAAAQGHADAQCNLGLLNERGEGSQQRSLLGKALAWYHKAARQGHRDAAFNLGTMHERGGDGVEKSDLLAVRFFRQAADKGCPRAQHNLGVMCFEGRAPAESYEDDFAGRQRAAVEWYLLASAQGHVDSQFNLALMLEECGDRGGADALRDLARALLLYEEAARLGDAQAAHEAGRLRGELSAP